MKKVEKKGQTVNNLVKPGDARATGSFCYLPSLLELLQVSFTVHIKPPAILVKF